MPLPDNFSPFEHLQDMLRLGHNKLVREYFSDIGDEDWIPDLTTPRSQLRVATTMTDTDTATMMLMRLYLFYDVIGFGRQNLANFYGSRVDDSFSVLGYPQLFFVFTQDEAATPPNNDPVHREKSIRLTRFATTTGNSRPAITIGNLRSIATEIKTLFTSNGRGITFTTGNKSASYVDPENGLVRGGYLLVNSRTDAIEIYQKICGCVDVPFDANKLVVNDPDKPSTTASNAGTVNILGQTVRKRAYRPVANVRFRYAFAIMGNIIPPTILIDTTLRKNGLVPFP